MSDRWEQRRKHIEDGAKYGGVRGMKAAERSWNANLNPPRRRNPITCSDCEECYLTTMICQKYNKSIADNAVLPWECDGFKPRKE